MAVLGWLALGLALALAGLVVDPTDGADASPIGSGGRLQSTAVMAEADDRAAFVAAWRRWETGEHAVSGVLVRRSGAKETEVRYREARLGRRWIQQIGPSVVLADDQGGRVCHQDRTGQFLCTTMAESDPPRRNVASTATTSTDNSAAGTGFGADDDAPDDTAADHTVTDDTTSADDTMADDTTAADDTMAGYTVAAMDHITVMRTVVGAEPARPGSCWEARVNPNPQTGKVITDRRWGVRSWFCFDTETGALMLRHTITGESTDTAVARIVSGEVTELDLAPSPTLAAVRAGTRG